MKFTIATAALLATAQAAFPGCSLTGEAEFLCVWGKLPKNSQNLVELSSAAAVIAEYKAANSAIEQPRSAAEILAICKGYSPSGQTWSEA